MKKLFILWNLVQVRGEVEGGEGCVQCPGYGQQGEGEPGEREHEAKSQNILPGRTGN